MNKYVVGRPEQPNLSHYTSYVTKIWNRRSLTNFGPYHQELEQRLQDYFEVNNVVLFANGTLALEAALCVLELNGEVLTPSFSFVATAGAIQRSNNKLLFCDVSKRDGNICVDEIQKHISPSTKLVLPVHVYGFSCEVEKINNVAKKNNCDVLYDAAHTFGSKLDREHLVQYGLASILSFHATKIFSTVEGGAVITADDELAKSLREFRSFGFSHAKALSGNLATNAKMSELHAAYGLLLLDSIDQRLRIRSDLFGEYYKSLDSAHNLTLLDPINAETINGAYVPVIIEGSPTRRKNLCNYLSSVNIDTKPYFEANLSDIFLSEKSVRNPVTDYLSQRILCLPVHSEMSTTDVRWICEKILRYCDE